MDIHEKLNIPEGLHGLSLVQKAVKNLRFQIWLKDIPHPGNVPEYIEHHESIQDILKFTDEVLEIIDSELPRESKILDLVCNGDCDDCPRAALVPGTGERIDREPAYICTLFN